MKSVRKIELLSPAKNLECGIEAINHGADAVYIGAPLFSARASAGNSIDDISRLSDYAHQYNAKVYVALNTILTEKEIKTAQDLVRDIHQAGADALIVQDMAFLNMELSPIELHASTQTDNRTIEKVKFLEASGFSQVVLARELSLDDIKDISRHTQVRLETFIHGALCVSYSGQCYISQALAGRSANKGNCAQFCRLPYNIQDAEGNILASNKHALSLKDLNQTKNLEKLIDAGVTSLKIEGRLKDVTYVKNVTAHYRKQLDDLFARRPEYMAASSGHCTYNFNPDPAKSFNRGFTEFFLHGRNKDISSFETPKSLGEPIGNIKDLNKNYFTLTGHISVHNGDGLCFLNEQKELQGFRVNKVEGNKIYPAEMPRLSSGITLFRNFDHEFEKLLLKKSAERRISINFVLEENSFGFTLTAIDEDLNKACVTKAFSKELSRKDQQENIRTQLSKLGNTIFDLETFDNKLSQNWFIPSSILSDLKRETIDTLLSVRKVVRTQSYRRKRQDNLSYPLASLTYLGNVSNPLAKEFYIQNGVKNIEPAFELVPPQDVPLMFSKHCIKYSLGYCNRISGSKKGLKEPLYLISGNTRLMLKFNCRDCEMTVCNM